MEVTRRLHIAGMTPSITLKDLENRFSRFGSVLSVEDCGRDGNGDPRKYCFMNFQANQAQLNKLMQTFSNSHWKDAKLRISEARPNYITRLEIDKEKAAEKERRKEFKRVRRLLQKKLRGNLKTYAKDMRLTTPYNAKWRNGWYITPAKHLIHPIHIRPDHPVPVPSTSRDPSKSSNDSKAPKPPKKSKQIMIDPRKYGPMHYGESMIGSENVSSDNRPWRCEQDEQGRVKWLKDGDDDEIYNVAHADPQKVYEENADQYNNLDDKVFASKPRPKANNIDEIENQVRRLEENEKKYDEDALSDDDEDEIFAMLESQRLRENRSESPLFEGAQPKSFDWLNTIPELDKTEQAKAQPKVDPSAEQIKQEHKSQNALLDSLFQSNDFGRKASIDIDSD
ncbi:hypothetical protein E3P92_03279 [Wallemia ichthyophaga]|uniref:RRM domain-containing protein n=2 Tax=Wallemia ichthyophaga TaxID=245174 RepID=A0A4T0KXW6_WALIC|nr:uncharacterized protein J056_003844 [Wallemia ichthyophaga EXF-994]TIA70030.1 hypothetical protein E3P91_03304 [Wallemia ichthyophaga]EOR01608.1 hypothetical protein J056_003844 [Wallemia ichthyophaga EXF-994]TIB09321.1 hypothetical protein E3P93_03215 [Wallemia ichthyophaga]TIB09505.1 hypothetical protein E3P90_03246 [Wallemia ichthyophaga]TIB10119.1 hypothetical protein E3P92_03279 [Wallemia ichthyophaga]